ncbi:MAG: ComEC/Rec2 family competence protein [Christensenellaceae bacterium]|jgi:ComEC/Rec2-like protein|nr:ComEC/Rec2 family competence protein [Clostridia bacterium]PWL99563.1 MAG: hypothetical protein DBY05_08255 [Clostridiales bacterium]
MKKFFSVAENRSDGKLFNFRPALFAAAFFALGILFAYGKKYGAVSSLWLLAGVPIFALSVGFAADRRRALFASGVLVLCFCFGGLSFTRAVQRFKDCGVYAGGHTVVGTIAEKKEYGRFSVLYLTDLYIDGTREQGQLVAAVGASLAEKAALSDEVVLRGTVTTDTDEFGPYGFRAGDIADNVRFKAEAVSLAVTGRDGNLFRAVRFRIKSALYAGMDDDTAAVAYALLTGDVSGIESGLLENVRRGGIAHIFAVSGLHVGALYSFCLLLFNKTRLKRLPKLFRFFFVSAILVFYGGVCGFSASVTRAAVMCLTLYASSLIGTKPDLPESAGLAALFLLIVRPVLLFDVGFQLSFAACLGIGTLSHTFRAAFSAPFARASSVSQNTAESFSLKLQRGLVSLLSVSLAAQIATAPILLHSFGYVSLWGLALNLLFVPLVGAAFSFLLVLAFVAALLPLAAAPILLYVPSMLWSALLLAFYAVDFSSFAVEGIRLGSAALLFYAFFIFLSDKLNLPGRLRKVLLGIICLSFAAAVCALNL